ncbi:MAG: hypothetical protein IKP81_07125 [Paludibacteraceae bacterium]|jgi:chromosome segregation ATPase|nr:hypothetical protein [Paludibacteraceae bacterium]MBP3717721.1 hypothetical protein [Paludibacteraceae bacterium]MBR6104812.1 hypothetical protein [Paludibacteraceae bacterium]
MAENGIDNVERLSESVDKLMSMCGQLRAERDAAQQRIAVLTADLAIANSKINTLEQKNRTLQSMQLGDVSVVAAKQNKAQLSRLVREIDRCIALLNT